MLSKQHQPIVIVVVGGPWVALVGLKRLSSTFVHSACTGWPIARALELLGTRNSRTETAKDQTGHSFSRDVDLRTNEKASRKLYKITLIAPELEATQLKDTACRMNLKATESVPNEHNCRAV